MQNAAKWSFVPALAVAALVVSAALGAQGATSSATARAGSAAQTFTVNVDGRNPKVNESFLGFYPSIVDVHAGDTVVFHYVGVGEPHTVTLGTLANNAVATFAKLPPAQQNNPPKSALAVDAKLPGLTVGNSLAVVPSVANPCFLASGLPSATKAPCATTAEPAFDGSQAYYNSGWLKNNERFTVHLSSSTPSGTYRFMCLVHREGMSGQISVVPASKSVASPATQFASGQKQIAKLEAALMPAAKLLAHGKPPIPGLTLPGPNPVLSGSGAPGSSGGIDQFGPQVVHIPVGGTVTWWLVGFHSITFHSTSTDNDIQRVNPNGTVQINAKAAIPAGGPGEPSNPPTGGTKAHVKFKVVASSSWNGQGFHNSGLFGNSDPPNIEGYQLKFTRAGTYKFICTVHDNMKGTIVVGSG